MEPVEHFLFGAALGRAGFNRLTGYATLVMVLAAEAPDLDVLYEIRGPVEGFKHHRGWTHSFLGSVIVAIVAVAFAWCVSKIWKRGTAVPIRWGRLFLLGWLAALSHLWLDYTNDYGLRPFWPFSGKWYEGDTVFILEPLMLGALALALIVPWILGLADREIGARRVVFRGQKWAWFALAFIAVLWTMRGIEHHRALNLMAQREWEAGEPKRIGLFPYPVNPFAWHGIVDTGDKYQTAHVDTLRDHVRTDANTGIYFKQPATPPIAAAEASRLGRVYMDWSSWPLVTSEQPEVDETSPHGTAITPVEFNDLRFDYDVLGLRGSSGGTKPLGAEVLVAPDGSIVQMKMGDSVER